MNIRKLTSVLSQSSQVFIPVNDPCDVTFNQAAEVVKACLEITFFKIIKLATYCHQKKDCKMW